MDRLMKVNKCRCLKSKINTETSRNIQRVRQNLSEGERELMFQVENLFVGNGLILLGRIASERIWERVGKVPGWHLRDTYNITSNLHLKSFK